MLLVEPTFICLLQPISYNPHCRQNWKNNTYQKKAPTGSLLVWYSETMKLHVLLICRRPPLLKLCTHCNHNKSVLPVEYLYWCIFVRYFHVFPLGWTFQVGIAMAYIRGTSVLLFILSYWWNHPELMSWLPWRIVLALYIFMSSVARIETPSLRFLVETQSKKHRIWHRESM